MGSRLLAGFFSLVMVAGCRGKPIGQQTVKGTSPQGTLTLAVTGPAEVKGSVSFENLLELTITVEVSGPPSAPVHLMAQERALEAAVGCVQLESLPYSLKLNAEGKGIERKKFGFGNRTGCELEVTADLGPESAPTGEMEATRALLRIPTN